MPTVNSPAIAVLCVDDNPQVLQAVKAALTTAGYAVEIAASGWSALQRLRTARDRLRVVVTDIRMPEMTGVRMIRQSRAVGYRGPFVVFAAGLLDADRASLIELGVQHMVDKTAGVATLIAAVKEAASTYTPAEAAPIARPAPAKLPVDEELLDEDAIDDAFDEEGGQRYHGPSTRGKKGR